MIGGRATTGLGRVLQGLDRRLFLLMLGRQPARDALLRGCYGPPVFQSRGVALFRWTPLPDAAIDGD